MTAPRVGFVGIGNMGWPMARRIAASRLRAHGARRRSGAGPAVRGGDRERRGCGRRSACPRRRHRRHHAADRQDRARRAARRRRRLRGRSRRGAVVIDMSSSDPTGTRELGAALAGRGVALVDAPVSGGVPRAAGRHARHHDRRRRRGGDRARPAGAGDDGREALPHRPARLRARDEGAQQLRRGGGASPRRRKRSSSGERFGLEPGSHGRDPQRLERAELQHRDRVPATTSSAASSRPASRSA